MRDYVGLISQAVGARKQIQKQFEDIGAEKKKATIRLKNIELSQAFLQEIARQTQEQLKIHVEDIVQLALDAIFPDQYQFKIQFSISYGRTSAELCFISKQSGYSIDPMVASGGGVVDICSFALRLACWTLSRGVDRVIVFDEPFRFLSQDLQERAGIMLRELAGRLGIQIIMTTHLSPLIESADRVIRVIKDNNGVSGLRVG